MLAGALSADLWLATGLGALTAALSAALLLSRRRCRRLTGLVARQQFQLGLNTAFTRDVVALVDAEGVIEYASASSQRTLGYRSEELLGLPVESLLLDGVPDGLLEPQEEVTVTCRIRHADGAIRWFDITSARVAMQGGSYIAVSFRDVTSRFLAEQESRREKNLVDTVINTMPGVFIVCDDRLRLVHWNRNLELITGYSADELATIFPGDLADMGKEDFLRVLRTVFDKGQVLAERPLVRKDGGEIPFWFTARRFVADGKEYMVGFGLNVSQRRQIERSFRRSIDLVRHLVEVSPAGITLLDTQGRVLSASPAFCRMLQADAGKVLGRPLQDLLHDDLRHRKAVGEWLDSGAPRELQQQVRRPDGSTLLVRVVPASLPADDDGPGFLLIFEDETVRHQHEAQLEYYAHSLEEAGRRQLEALERERRDIARELHDGLGQLLTAVRLRLNNALANDEAVKRRRLLKQVDQEIGQALDDIRRLSRNLRPSALDDFGLEAALRWLVESVTSALPNPPALDLQLDGLGGRLDQEIETACFRIAQEALNNAVKHAAAETIRVTLAAGREGLSLQVFDDGSGFDVRAARQGASSGKSFGMVSMRERAQLVGGSFEILSDTGRGTRVDVWLPCSPSPRPAVMMEMETGGGKQQ